MIVANTTSNSSPPLRGRGLLADDDKNPPYDLANISQEYRRDVDDFEWLCRSCHMKKDGRIL